MVVKNTCKQSGLDWLMALSGAVINENKWINYPQETGVNTGRCLTILLSLDGASD